jgi:photosystem II stability/assembly factor-like uncharacterized protein
MVNLNILGCLPDRFPVSPEEYETRRPKVAYVIPVEGDTVAKENSLSVQVWFDELMNTQSVQNMFSLQLAVGQEIWTTISSVKSLAQSTSDPALLYLGRPERGAFVSFDLGRSWKFLQSLAEYKINQIKIDPNTSAIIYVITDSLLLKTSNSAQTWESINNNLPQPVIISSFDFEPGNSSKIWIGTSAGIFYSEDAGSSWSQTGTPPQWTDQTITKIEVDYSDHSIVYAATLGRYLYKSIDSGITWELKRGTSDALGASRIYDIAIDPDSSIILYAATINRGIYKSIDAGENWIAINSGIEDWNARKIRFHTAAGNALYMATPSNLYRSSDKGKNWIKLSIPAAINIQEFFGDNNNSFSLFLAASDNLYFSSDNGTAWVEQNSIDTESILVPGSFEFSTWQDTLQFIESGEEGELDTIKIAPYRYDGALAAYDAGFISEPPVDPNPKATTMLFTAHNMIFSNWMYRLCIQGIFKENNYRSDFGARDINGISLEFDYISFFYLN